jgi:hypothetical protein
MTIRKELVAALQLRYGSATFSDRIRILDELVALTGYHRKHAISGAAAGRLWPPERHRCDERAGAAIRVIAVVH